MAARSSCPFARIRAFSRISALVDYAEATGIGDDSGYDRFAEYVEFYRSAGNGPRTARIALYIPERSAIFGALRQFLAMAGDEERHRIFTDMNEARAWVGLPPA